MKIIIAGGAASTAFISAVSDVALSTVMVESPGGGRVPFEFGRVALDPELVIYLFGTRGQDQHPQVRTDLLPGALGGVILVDPEHPRRARPAVTAFQSAGVPFVLATSRHEAAATPGTDATIRAALGVTDQIAVRSCALDSRDCAKVVLTGLIEQLMRPTLNWPLPLDQHSPVTVDA